MYGSHLPFALLTLLPIQTQGLKPLKNWSGLPPAGHGRRFLVSSARATVKPNFQIPQVAAFSAGPHFYAALSSSERLDIAWTVLEHTSRGGLLCSYRTARAGAALAAAVAAQRRLSAENVRDAFQVFNGREHLFARGKTTKAG